MNRMMRIRIVGGIVAALALASSASRSYGEEGLPSAFALYAIQDNPTERLDAAIVSPASRPATAPSTLRPEASSAAAGQFPASGGSFGLEEFARHFAPHEPVYFIGGWDEPNVKFQLSLRYRILTPGGPLVSRHPLLRGFNLAYSQTSLWDVSKPSAPFFDSSYRPEAFYYLENILHSRLPSDGQIGFQIGANHESNGRDGSSSRSLNVAYIRPIFTISADHDLFLTFAPKIYLYLGDLGDNPEIKRYRGFTDLRLVVGQRDGLQLASIGRVGDHGDRASGQFDLTYPLTKILNGNADLLLDAQYFVGYGESLLTYRQRTSVFRLGISLIR